MNKKDIELNELMNLRMMKNKIESIEAEINACIHEIEHYEECQNGSEDGLFSKEDFMRYKAETEKELERYLKEAREITSEYTRSAK